LHSGNVDFSFAGLTTAVLTLVKKIKEANAVALDGALTDIQKHNLAASTQAAIVECLVKKSLAALAQCGLTRLVVAGGVGANQHLRQSLNTECAKRGIRVHYPELRLCTDNGAMIAYAAALRLQAGASAATKTYSFAVRPRWPLSEL
jgi:N6-L-threonylcarbamoyladenine synthase